jgi:hypothetical protein
MEMTSAGIRNAGRMLRSAWRAVRLALGTVRYLGTMRRAFPWPLRVLLIIGAIQVPFSPLDEVCAVIGGLWLLICYRPTLRVAYRAAQLDTFETI